MYTKITQAPFGIEENKWHNDLTNDQHHGLKCISSSQLKYLHSGKSLSSFQQKYIHKSFHEESKEAFRIGTLAHLAVLEPDKFKKYVFVCEHKAETIAYRETRLALANSVLDGSEEKALPKKKRKMADLDEDEAKTIIFSKNGGFYRLEDNEEIFMVSPSEYKMYTTFQEKCAKHPMISRMLENCVIEQTGTAKDPLTDIWMSVRGDMRNTEKGYFADPKTFDGELTPSSIERYITQWALPIQAAHYCRTGDLIDGFNTYNRFYFIFLSKKPPFEIALVLLNNESLQWGHEKCRLYLDKLHECETSGIWPEIDYNPKPNKNFLESGLSRWELNR